MWQCSIYGKVDEISPAPLPPGLDPSPPQPGLPLAWTMTCGRQGGLGRIDDITGKGLCTAVALSTASVVDVGVGATCASNVHDLTMITTQRLYQRVDDRTGRHPRPSGRSVVRLCAGQMEWQAWSHSTTPHGNSARVVKPVQWPEFIQRTALSDERKGDTGLSSIRDHDNITTTSAVAVRSLFLQLENL